MPVMTNPLMFPMKAKSKKVSKTKQLNMKELMKYARSFKK
jgi:hypothetical protein